MQYEFFISIFYHPFFKRKKKLKNEKGLDMVAREEDMEHDETTFSFMVRNHHRLFLLRKKKAYNHSLHLFSLGAMGRCDVTPPTALCGGGPVSSTDDYDKVDHHYQPSHRVPAISLTTVRWVDKWCLYLDFFFTSQVLFTPGEKRIDD